MPPKHHGNIALRSDLPWKCSLGEGPTIRAMWCVPSSFTQDNAGATVFIREKKDALIVYVVEGLNAPYNVDSVLTGLHRAVWWWWRNGAFGISVQEFLDVVEHLNVAGCPFQQLLPKIVKAGVRNRREGIYHPEHTVTLCIRHLQARPMPTGPAPAWDGIRYPASFMRAKRSCCGRNSFRTCRFCCVSFSCPNPTRWCMRRAIF